MNQEKVTQIGERGTKEVNLFQSRARKQMAKTKAWLKIIMRKKRRLGKGTKRAKSMKMSDTYLTIFLNKLDLFTFVTKMTRKTFYKTYFVTS